MAQMAVEPVEPVEESIQELPSRNRVLKTLAEVFNGLTEVKVITILGTPTVTVTEVNKRTTTTFTPPSGKVDAFVTVFNLSDGDATNVVSNKFIEDQTLRELHAAQVEKSLAVLPANIEALVKLAKAIIGELDKE